MGHPRNFGLARRVRGVISGSPNARPATRRCHAGRAWAAGGFGHAVRRNSIGGSRVYFGAMAAAVPRSFSMAGWWARSRPCVRHRSRRLCLLISSAWSSSTTGAWGVATGHTSVPRMLCGSAWRTAATQLAMTTEARAQYFHTASLCPSMKSRSTSRPCRAGTSNTSQPAARWPLPSTSPRGGSKARRRLITSPA